MISGVVYLLRIFKMFHGLMNNPVFKESFYHSFWIVAAFVSEFLFALLKVQR